MAGKGSRQPVSRACALAQEGPQGDREACPEGEGAGGPGMLPPPMACHSPCLSLHGRGVGRATPLSGCRCHRLEGKSWASVGDRASEWHRLRRAAGQATRQGAQGWKAWPDALTPQEGLIGIRRQECQTHSRAPAACLPACLPVLVACICISEAPGPPCLLGSGGSQPGKGKGRAGRALARVAVTRGCPFVCADRVAEAGGSRQGRDSLSN